MNPGTQTNQRLFSESLLAQYDGTDHEKPVFIAVGRPRVSVCAPCFVPAKLTMSNPIQIDGDVYDVSSNRATYGPGGSYHMMCVYVHALCTMSIHRHWR